MEDLSNRKKILNIFSLLFFLSPSLGFIFFKTQSSEQLIKDYIVAKKNNNCVVLKELANSDNFSLKDIAYIRFYKMCPHDPDDRFHWSSFPKWLKKEAIEASYHRASKKENVQKFIQYAQEMSQFSTDKSEKIRYIQHAIKVARDNHSEEITALREKLYQLAPSYNPKPQLKDYLKVARDYKRRGLYGSSIRYYRSALNAKSATAKIKRDSFKALIELYRVTHQSVKHQKAVRQYDYFQKRNLSHSKGRSYFFDSKISLAKKYWNMNRTSQALRILFQIEKMKGAPLMRIYWLRGKIYENISKHSLATVYLKKSLKHHSGKKDNLYEEMLWSLAWNLKKVNKKKEALDIFQKLIDSFPFTPKYMYWKARVFLELDKKRSARKLFNRLIKDAPLDYHGILSHYHVNVPLSLEPIQKRRSLFQRTKDDPYKIVDHLILAQEEELVTSFIEHAISQYRRVKNNTRHSQMFLLFKKSAQAGLYLPFFRFVGQLPTEEKSIFMKKYTHLLFPQIYQKEVQKAETLFNIPSEFIYSIIRQESAFNFKARSPSDAMGLMQILPRVAKQTARDQGIFYKEARDLYNPRVNVLIGAAHLKWILRRYGNHLILNSAIYNAGHRPVLNWLKKFSTKDPIEFIQNIPYQETRYYVKLVMRNFIIYKLLNSPEFQMEFPEWILTLPNKKYSSVSY